MTNQEIREYLREPATEQQRNNAKAVHSAADIQEERRQENMAMNLERFWKRMGVGI